MKQFIFGFIVFLFSQQTFTQDLLIKSEIDFKTVECDSLFVENNILKYYKSGSVKPIEIKINKVASLSLTENNILLRLPYLKLDTVLCRILNINSKTTEYLDQKNNWKLEVNNNNIFACVFEGSVPTEDFYSKMDIYKQSFRNKRNRSFHSFLLNDNRETLGQLISIQNNSVNLNYEQTEKKYVQTYLFRNKVKSITLNEEFVSYRSNGIYILSSGNNVRKLESVSIHQNDIEIGLLDNTGNPLKVTQDKTKTQAILYNDYSRSFNQIEPDLNPISETNTKPAYIYFTLYGAYMLGESPNVEGLKDYVNDMRTGIAFSAEMNFFVNKSVGLGGFFNYSNHKTSASDLDVIMDDVLITNMSETISAIYFGPNLVARTYVNPFFTNELSTSIGLFTVNNKANINYTSVSYTANSVGLRLHERPTFTFGKKGQAIYLDLSLYLATYTKIKFRGQKIDLDEPLSVSQICVGIGLKL